MIRNTIFHAPDDNNKYSINSDGSIDINVDETPRNSEELKIHIFFYKNTCLFSVFVLNW